MSLAVKHQLMVAPASFRSDTRALTAFFRLSASAFRLRSCLRQRLPDEESLYREVQALEQERNEARARINWRFGIQDARAKLQIFQPGVWMDDDVRLR